MSIKYYCGIDAIYLLLAQSYIDQNSIAYSHSHPDICVFTHIILQENLGKSTSEKTHVSDLF